MNSIDKNDSALRLSDAQRGAWQRLIGRIAGDLTERGCHPARCVVLLPFAQLMPLARQAWGAGVAHYVGQGELLAVFQSFSPRFETTRNWASGLQHWQPAAHDVQHDRAWDLMVARSLLARAGLASAGDAGVAKLLDAAYELASVAAAVPPDARADWLERQRVVLPLAAGDSPVALDAAVSRVALEWAGASGYASDILFSAGVREQTDCLITVHGVQTDALADALAAHWGANALKLDWAVADDSAWHANLQLHACQDAEDEAERAAACVLAHVAAGRVPVGLVAQDRLLTRRVRAYLGAHAMEVRDETGWKLSTTHSATTLMALLRAARHDANTDDMLQWLKLSPAFDAGAVNALEKAFRKEILPNVSVIWSYAAIEFKAIEKLAEAARQVGQASQAALQWLNAQDQPLANWLAALRQALAACGLWDALCADEAGQACVDALHLRDGNRNGNGNGGDLNSYQDRQPLRLQDFSAWVSDVLESASFVAKACADAAVVIVPLSQVLGRPLAALVLPGADETHLSAAPEPAGAWSRLQRESLGLPSREASQAAQRLSWQTAQSVAHIDVLWRASAGAEAVLASPLLQEWRLAHPKAPLAADPRAQLLLPATPTERPQPVASSLPICSLSASSYEDMRKCPYRYFALRMLGLQEQGELDQALNKGDYGTWLHAVLRAFHVQRLQPFSAARDLALVNSIAQQLAPQDGGFVPYGAMWPRVRDGYLAWLADFESQGWRFAEAEKVCKISHEGIDIKGAIDRIDTLSHSPLAGMPFLLDYKTESSLTTAGRIKEPLEDTQLAVYAALLQDDELQAGYVNISEDQTKLMVQTAVLESRDALLAGLVSDVQRIAAGAALPALGEGAACNFCAARGLCRKDSWEVLNQEGLSHAVPNGANLSQASSEQGSAA